MIANNSFPMLIESLDTSKIHVVDTPEEMIEGRILQLNYNNTQGVKEGKYPIKVAVYQRKEGILLKNPLGYDFCNNANDLVISRLQEAKDYGFVVVSLTV